MTLCTFLDLPPELQFLIKDCISPSDIRTHVCFYLSDPQCASLYDSLPNPDMFWKLMCWNNGLGQLPHESTSETETTWRDIATSTILADAFCTHPQCGEALLAYNREKMLDATKHGGVHPFSPLHITSRHPPNPNPAESPARAHPALHDVLAHISFRPNEERHTWSDPSFPASRDAHLRSLPESDDAEAVEWEEPDRAEKRAYVWRHALVARSFATFAPSVSVVLFDVGGVTLMRDYERVCGVAGRAVTVMEVLELLHENMNIELTVRDFAGYVQGHEGCMRRHEWAQSLYEAMMFHLRTLRLLLAICPIQGVAFEAYTEDGPAFRIDLQ